MSGLVKGVGKVFKKVGKFVAKNWQSILMAAAVVYTAGAAAGYFGTTAAAAQSTTVAGAGLSGASAGAAAAAGTTAASIGATGFATGLEVVGAALPGTLSATSASVLAGTSSLTGASIGAQLGGAGLSGGFSGAAAASLQAQGMSTVGMAAAKTVEQVGMNAVVSAGATASPAAAQTTFLGKVGAGLKTMSSTDKLLLLKTGVGVASALTQKTGPGNFSGRDKHGRGPGMAVDFQPSGNVQQGSPGNFVMGGPAPPRQAPQQQGSNVPQFNFLPGG